MVVFVDIGLVDVVEVNMGGVGGLPLGGGI